MFDIGFWELLILAGLGLMILGPERLPRVVGQLGRWLRKARRTASQLRWQIEHELDLTERREAEQKRRKAAPPAPPPKSADNADGSGASHADAGFGDANTPVSDPVSNASPPAGSVPGGVTTDAPARMPDAGATATPAPEPEVSAEERERRAPSQH